MTTPTRAPRFNHVAMSVPAELLGEDGRRDHDSTQLFRQRLPRRVRFAGDDVGDTTGAGGGDRQRTDRPAPGHEDAVSGADAAACQTMERDREGLGQRGGPHRHARGHPQELRLPHAHEIGERALELADARVAATDAQLRPPGEAVLALAAALRRPADDLVARRPRRDLIPHRDHATRELVPADRVRRAPPVDEHMEVAAAHAAVAHLEQDVVGAELRDRPLLDDDVAPPSVDGRAHRSRKGSSGVS